MENMLQRKKTEEERRKMWKKKKKKKRVYNKELDRNCEIDFMGGEGVTSNESVH